MFCHADKIIAISALKFYGRISALSCLKLMGAGGYTPNPPVRSSVSGGFIIFVDGIAGSGITYYF